MDRTIVIVKLLVLLMTPTPLALTLPLKHNVPQDSSETRNIPTPMARQRPASSDAEVTIGEISTQGLEMPRTSE